MTSVVDELVAIAEEGARLAGELLLGSFGGRVTGISAKTSPTDLVSDADRASEELLVGFISERRPADGILSEEGGSRDAASGYTWVIDPLDGTINYLYGIPVWAVSVGIEDDEGAVAGVVHDPSRNETFVAARGRGTTLNGTPVKVAAARSLDDALIGTGFSYLAAARERQAAVVARVLPRVRDVRRTGSAALDLASVACGRLDGLYEAPTEPWDKSAGTLLVREAGGIVSRLPPPLPTLSPGIVAAGPDLHPALSALVAGTP